MHSRELEPDLIQLTFSLRSALFWDIAQRIVVNLTDVSGQPIGPIFMGQEIQFLDP